ncbi:MAG: heavy metal-binding domain-containing protein [Armatimonadetes bacterium]|nr:heavy metal-binding domain-containing protein [Armatimonadota bacterium]MDE2207306.1 heavy metal-binding domain-containing protein [Armatimonadota bacterium]
MSNEPMSTAGLPEAALRRLGEMLPSATKKGLFTSDLSVNELTLVRESGFEPLGLVMGSSIYHIGFQMTGIFQSQELSVLTQAMYQARELAMTRMEEEASLLGADGVVGVRLVVNQSAWGEGLAEFMAIGTAIKRSDGQSFRCDDGKPFTSDLSGQDFWTLLRTGYRPLALVMGACVYFVAYQGVLKALKQMGRNVEMDNYTQALYDARELALSRIQAEAEARNADGIIGQRVQESNYAWGSHVIEFFSIGTAVRAWPNPGSILVPAPVISLTD